MSKSNPLPKYVFRGTTYNFEGGRASISKPFRCYTTPNPLKAYYFAKACHVIYSAQPVIYVAEYEKLINRGIVKVAAAPNALIEIEEEIAWEIKPVDFYKHCEGYITLNQMSNALKKAGKPPKFSPDLETLTTACWETGKMSVNEIENLVKIIMPLVKYP